MATGKALREAVPRDSHARWKPPARRRDPIDVLEESNRNRVRDLVPIRYGRMLRSPFTFLRGSAGLMAYDLAATPGTVLARAHAKSGDAATISGYLGKKDEFDEALGEFAQAYADQTVRDHAALVAAVKAGRIKVRMEEDS